MSNTHALADLLSLFDHATYTFAYINGNGKMRSFGVGRHKVDDAIQLLREKNEKDHAEIYFMVNEGTGKTNAKGTAAHRSENVTSLSALFLDAELADGTDPFPAIRAFVKEHNFHPHAVIETSPNRYHVYWLLDHGTPVTKENIIKWKLLQKFLHSKLSCDTTMTDLPQVLRLPTFHNHKKDSPVTIRYLNKNQARYTLTETFSAFSQSYPELHTATLKPPLDEITEDYTIDPGNRHDEILRRTRKLLSIPSITDGDVRCFVDGLIHRHVPDNKDFLPNGSRRSEIERIITSAKQYAEEERQREAQAIIQRASEEHANKKTRSQFEQDPDFFYQAPGLVGDLTRFIVNNTLYPIPSIAFAMSASFIGFLKSRYIRTEHGIPPLNYFLCFAPAGSGKTDIQRYIRQTMEQLHLTRYFQESIASAQGMLQFLENTKGLGIIVYDEIKELFEILQSRRAATHELKISFELTRLYTAYNSFVSLPQTKGQRGAPTVIKNPHLSFIGFGHPHQVDSLFSKDTILDGLLPRFLIFNVTSRSPANPKFISPATRLPASLEQALRELVVQSGLAAEQEHVQACTEIEKAEQDDSDPKDQTAAKKDKETLPEAAPPPSKQTIHFTPEALSLYRQFAQEVDSLYQAEVTAGTALEALFSRATEQVSRLAATLTSTHQIDAATLSYATSLVRSQILTFHQRINTTINTPKTLQDTNHLYDKIVEACAKSPTYSIAKRELHRSARRMFKNTREYNDALQELINDGRIAEFDFTTPSGQKTKQIRLETV